MAIKRVFKKRFKGVTVKSGHIYTFKYQAWEHDPRPVVIMMYAIDGIHPRTKHQHRYFQAINFTYIPRSIRKQFARDWSRTYRRTNGNVKFTWELVQRRYPYLKHAVRRYFFKPNYYINELIEVPWEDMEKVVVSTWSKDFSKKLRMSLLGKFRRAMRGRFGFGPDRRRR
jgi:hypothetical protein